MMGRTGQNTRFWIAGLAAVLAAGLFTMVLWRLAGPERQPAAFEPVYSREDGQASNLTMLDGNTGRMVSTSEPDVVEHCQAWLESLLMRRQADQRPRGGYLYWLDLQSVDGRVKRFTFSERSVTVDGVHYDLNRSVRGELQALFALIEQGALQ
jgi:hypothetical protein